MSSTSGAQTATARQSGLKRPGEESRKQPDKGAKRGGEQLAQYREARHKRKQRRQPHKHSQTGRQAEGRTAYPAFRQDAPGDEEARYYVN